jgi:ornithine decarboxylase
MQKGTRVLLRIRADDPEARCNLGIKYGAEEHEWDELLNVCKAFGVILEGVSFHVGSMAQSVEPFVQAISKCRILVDMALSRGFQPHIIDIGGGFSSTEIFDLGPIPNTINNALDAYFPQGFTFMAEPGRFMVEHVATLYTPVIGVKGNGVTIGESLYGAFNCIVFDHATPTITKFLGPSMNELTGPLEKKMLFGSTCDGADIIYRECEMLDVRVGDWLEWARMGAYTSAATTSFNGIPFNNRLKVYIEC